MARLVLKLDHAVLRESSISDAPVTIGRLPDNTIQVDDLSISGHHARIVREQGKYVLYDQNSTNGTYVNGQKVARAVLTDGDTIHVARHTLTFTDNEPETVKPAPGLQSAPLPSTPAAPQAVGVITVLDGKTDLREYLLTAEENVIGKSETAAIRLTRWFAPKYVAAIHCRAGKFFISQSQTPIGVRVNSELVHGERELAPGDTILVDEVTLQFHQR